MLGKGLLRPNKKNYLALWQLPHTKKCPSWKLFIARNLGKIKITPP
jgi:hypothetical protein